MTWRHSSSFSLFRKHSLDGRHTIRSDDHGNLFATSKWNNILYAYAVIWKWLEILSVEYNMSCHMIYMYFIVAILVCSPNAVHRCRSNVKLCYICADGGSSGKARVRLASRFVCAFWCFIIGRWCPYSCHWWFSLTVRKCKEYWKQYSSMLSCFVFYVCCMNLWNY